MQQRITAMIEQVKTDLEDNILPFWMKYMTDKEQGGYYGYATSSLEIDKTAPKSSILNSRILWTYSTAYRVYGLEAYRRAADHAFVFMKKAFWDPFNSGLFWMADYRGNPIDKKKQIYNIAFGIYGLSEYYRAFGSQESLDMAISLYDVIERYSLDPVHGGYTDAFSEQWEKIIDMRLSQKDINAVKTMNTHLHILEAYTNLYRVWKNDGLKSKLQGLIKLTLEKIIDPDTNHFRLFFTEEWQSLSPVVSYGHDIEGSWLLCEAAEVLEMPSIISKVQDIAVKMVDAMLEEGYDKVYGGIYNEALSAAQIDFRKEWWPQAEAIAGLANLWCLTGADKYLEPMLKTWEFIYKYVIDHQDGEWFSCVSRNGIPDETLAKVEPWKCPYHNSRAMFEFLRRAGNVDRKETGTAVIPPGKVISVCVC